MDIQTYDEPKNWRSGLRVVPKSVLSKESAHEKDELHLSAHLLILDDEGKICCRKRAADDFRYAGMWTTTIGTHVSLGENYLSTLRPLLPIRLALNRVGEFRVHDQWENEINVLYYCLTNKDDLPKEFLIGRRFLSRSALELEIAESKTTPHLKEAHELLVQELF